jgi:hypothetical protein
MNEPRPCPECNAGKHQNCDNHTLDETTDELVPCPCSEAGHEPGMTLYHFTCSHGFRALGRRGILLPAAQLTPKRLPPWGSLVWLTDMAVPMREALGLSMVWSACDRAAYRYRVTDPSNVRPWYLVAPWWREALERSPGARPMHWFVSADPVPVEYAS